MRDEPKRWTAPGSEAPEELRQLMRAARQEPVAVSDVQSLRERLARTLPKEAGLLQPTPPPATTGLPRWLTWVAGGVGTAAVAWFATRTPSSVPPPEEPAAPAVSPSVSPPPPEPALVAPPSVAPPSVPTPRVAEPERAESSEAPRALAPKVKAPPRRALPGINATEDEAKLLERARAALATQPSLAFALTEEHSRRFARGALREEREVVAIEALRKLGKKHIAAQRAARFEQRYPGSVHLEKIRGRR